METDERLQRYAALLRASPHNLMSPRGLEELEARHLPECQALADSLPRSDAAPLTLLDVGSGGGLPGVIIAVVRPDIEVHLLEATGKKADFLRDVTAQLGLRLEVHHGRAEDLARTGLAGSYDLVTARAVAPLHRLLGWTLPFLCPGGLLYAVKGERWSEELDEATDALRRMGGSVVATPAIGTEVATVRSVIVQRVAAGDTS